MTFEASKLFVVVRSNGEQLSQVTSLVHTTEAEAMTEKHKLVQSEYEEGNYDSKVEAANDMYTTTLDEVIDQLY